MRRIAGILLAALLLGTGFAQADSSVPVVTLSAAHFSPDPHPLIPGEDAQWEPATLPDRWNVTHPEANGFIWYRLSLPVDKTPNEPYAIHIPRVSMNLALYLNGQLIGSGGSFSEPVARNWNRTMLFDIPASLLRPGENLIHLRVFGYRNSNSGLSEIEVGPATALSTRYERRHFWQTTGAVVTTSLMFAVAFLGAVAWYRRRDPMYAFFAGAALVWALRNLNLLVRDIPMSTAAWTFWVQSGNGWFFVLFALFILRYIEVRMPRLEKLLWAFAAIGPAGMLIDGQDGMRTAQLLWLIPAIPLWFVLVGLIVRHARQARDAPSVLVAGAFTAFGLLTFYDWMVFRGRLPFDWIFLGHYAAPVMFMLIAWLLIHRYSETFDAYVALNGELELRVAERERALLADFTAIQQLQRDQAAAEERQRIVREMHDGLGGYLTTTLRMAESGEARAGDIAAQLRECLDQLKLTVDSLQPVNGDLTAVIANLRYRLGPRLEKAGLKFDWQVGDLPRLDYLTPQDVLQIQRIAQEAFVNVLRRATADTVTVLTGVAPSGESLFVEIRDNGRDDGNARMLAALVTDGMRHRAAAIGADIDCSIDSGGYAVRLTLPFRRQAASVEKTAAL
jgi:signal transduction histidine kinase